MALNSGSLLLIALKFIFTYEAVMIDIEARKECREVLLIFLPGYLAVAIHIHHLDNGLGGVITFLAAFMAMVRRGRARR